MRVMVLVKASPSSEAGEAPSQELMEAMGNYNQELVDAGILLAGEGLKPTSAGIRVRFRGRERIVTDGPFLETNELLAGYWVWNVRSMEEALDWVKRCPNPMKEDSDIEIRPIYETSDFAEFDPTGTWSDHEEGLRRTLARRHSTPQPHMKVTPWLGFQDQAEEAARFYVSLIPDSRIVRVVPNPESGAAMVVQFELGGLPITALNTGQDWKFSHAVSLSVECDTQEEIDRIWDGLKEGGQEIQCGWVGDRYGLAWQVVPAELGNWMSDSDTTRSGRVMHALMQMVKLDLGTLRAAYEGREA